MFSSVSACAPNSLITVDFYSDKYQTFNIWSNVTVSVNGTVTNTRPIKLNFADYVEATVTSPPEYLDYTFYEYQLDFKTQYFAIVNKNNYTPTVKPGDVGKTWYNYVPSKFLITYYNSGKQQQFGFNDKLIDMEHVHIVLDHINDAVYFYGDNQVLITRVALPAGPIEYSKFRTTNAVTGKVTTEALILCGNRKLYRVIFDCQYYDSGTFTPTILPVNALEALWFDTDTPAGQSYIDARRAYYQSKINPPIKTMSVNADYSRIWIAGLDTIFIINSSFQLLARFSQQFSKFISIACLGTAAIAVTKSGEVYHVTEDGTFSLLLTVEALGTTGSLNNASLVAIPDPNHQQIIFIEAGSLAISYFATPDMAPAYAREFGKSLWVTGHDNNQVYRITSPLDLITLNSTKRIDVFEFDNKVTLISAVNSSYLAVHYLQEFVTLDLTGIKKVIPLQLTSAPGPKTNIGTKPVSIKMLGEENLAPITSPDLTFWVNGLSGSQNIFSVNSGDYLGVSFRAYNNGTYRRTVILGDRAIDCDFTVISTVKPSDFFIPNSVAPNRLNQFSTLTNITVIPAVNFGNVNTGAFTHVQLGFDWVMYGNVYSNINVSTDGYITFGNDVAAVGPVSFGNLNFNSFYAEELTDMYVGDIIDNSDPNNVGPAPIGGKDVSISFNGTNQYLYTQVSSPAAQFTFGTNNFTIEFWVKFNNVTATQTIIDHRSTYATEIVPTIYLISSHLRYLVNGVDCITGSTTLLINTWYHVAVTRNGNNTNMFLNGVREGSTYTDNNNYTSTRIVVGANVSGAVNLNGYLFNIRTVNGVAVYTANFDPSTERLTVTQQSNTNGYPSAAIPYITQTSFLLTNNFVDTSKYGVTLINNGTCVESTQVPFNRTILAPGLYYALGSLNDFNYFRLRWVGAEAQPFPSGNLLTLISSTTSSTKLVVSDKNSTNVGDYVSGTGITVSTRVTGYELGILYSVAARKINTVDHKVILTTPTFDITTLPIAATVSNVLATVNHTLTGTNSARFNRTGIPTADRLLYVNPAATTLYVDGTVNNSITADYTLGLPILSTKNLSGLVNKGWGASIPTNTYSCIPTSFGPFANTGSMFFNGVNRLTTSLGGDCVSLGVYCWTIEFWCYVIDDTNRMCLLAADPVTGQKWALYRARGGSAVEVESPIAITRTTLSLNIPINAWVHVAIVGGRSSAADSYTNETSKIYVDGVASAPFTTINRGIYGNKAAYTIGMDILYNNSYFKGYISNFRLVNNIRVYTAEFTPPTLPFTAEQEPDINGVPSSRIIHNTTPVIFDLTGTEMLATTVDDIGIIIDRSDYASQIINYGGVGLTNVGPASGINGRYTFNGTNQYLSFPAWVINNLSGGVDGDYTIECWIYRTSDPGVGSFISAAIPIVSAINADSNMIWSITNTGYLFGDRHGNNFISLTASIPNRNQWAHIAFVNVVNVMHVYLNGTDVGSVTLSELWNSSLTAAAVGYNNSVSAKYFQGYISNLRIVAGVAVYTEDFTVPTHPFKKSQLSDANGVPSAAVAAMDTMLLLTNPSTPSDITNVTGINSTTNLITVTGVPAETNTVYVSQTDYDKVYENQYVPMYSTYILQKKTVSGNYALVFDTNLSVNIGDQFNTATTEINLSGAISSGTVPYISTNDTVKFSIDELTLDSVANLITGPLKIQQQFVVVDRPQTLSSGTSLLFKTKIPVKERTYEVGMYSGLSYQFLEFFYNNDNHAYSASIGASSESVSLSSSTHANPQTSVVFAGDVSDGKWRLLGPGGFTETSIGYVPYGQLETFKSVPLFSNQSRVELFVSQEFPTNANVLIATTFGYLSVNGAEYTGTQYLKKNDVISLTVPYNTSMSIASPMLSIAEVQIVLPMLPDNATNPIFENAFPFVDQDLGVYITATAIVPIDDLYYIPEYYRKTTANAGNDYQFYRTNLDVFREPLTPGQYYYLQAGDQIDVDNIITSSAIYDSRDIVITSSSQVLRMAVKTKTGPIFDYLTFETLIDPFARQQTYTVGNNTVTVDDEVFVTANLILTASTTVVSNLYIDTLNANILINGANKNNYATNVTNGNKVAISRKIVNYMEPPVTIYQVKFDSAIASNVYIPIGKWDIQNKVISSSNIISAPTSLRKEIKTQVASFNNSVKLLKLSPTIDQKRLLTTKLIGGLITSQTSMKSPALKTVLPIWTGGFAPKKNSLLWASNSLPTKLAAKHISSPTTIFNKPIKSNLYTTQSILKNKNIQPGFSAVTTFAKSTTYKAILNSTYTFLKSTQFKTVIGTNYTLLRSIGYQAASGANYAFLKSSAYQATMGTNYSLLRSTKFQSSLATNYAFLKSSVYTAAASTNYAFLKSPVYTAASSTNYAFLKSTAYQSLLNSAYAYLKSMPYVAIPGSNFALLRSKPIEAKSIERYSVLISNTYKPSTATAYSIVKGNNYKSVLNANYSYYKSSGIVAVSNTNYSMFKSLKFVTSNGSNYSYLPVPKLITTLVTPYTYRGPAPFKTQYTFTTEQTVKLFDTSSTVGETVAKAPIANGIAESTYSTINSKEIKPAVDLTWTELSANVVPKMISLSAEMPHAPVPIGDPITTETFASSTLAIETDHLIAQELPPQIEVEHIVPQNLTPTINDENFIGEALNTEIGAETQIVFQSFPMEIDIEHLVNQDLPAVADGETVVKVDMPSPVIDIDHLLLPIIPAEVEGEHLVSQNLQAVPEFDSLIFNNSFPIEREEPEYFIQPILPPEIEIEHLVPQDLPAVPDVETLMIPDAFKLDIEIEHLVPDTIAPVIDDEHLVQDTIAPALDAEHLINSNLILELDQEILWGTDQIDIGGAASTYISVFANQSRGRGLVNSTAELPMIAYTKEYAYINDKAYLTSFDAFDKASKYYAADAVKIATTDYWNYRIYFNEHHFCVPKKGRIFPVTWYIQGG